MVRLPISFKDNSPEEMALYREILRRSCGAHSAYVKSVFRELYQMDEYVYQVKRTKKDEESTTDEEAAEENANEEVAATSDEQEEPQKAQEKEESYSDDYDQELDDDELELEELPEVVKFSREFDDDKEKAVDNKEESKPTYKPMNIGSCLQAFEQVNK